MANKLQLWLGIAFEKNKLKPGVFEGNVSCENTFSIQTLMWPFALTVAQSPYKHTERAANKHRV